MIPDQCQTESSAERRIFQLLKEDPGTASWQVLHSLGLARRRDGRYGEIDFVVLIPGSGILCIEVKGGRVSCRDGVWYTQNRFGESSRLNRSPFMQAREGMFALRDALSGTFGRDRAIGRCPIGSVVVFPDVSVPPRTPEFDSAEAVGADDLRRPISRALRPAIDTYLVPSRSAAAPGFPTRENLSTVLHFLRPEFDLVVARSAIIGHAEAQLLGLTEEQYVRLDELQDNPRCLFEGAAGTGKTLLALEFARRSAHADRHTLLVCFNKLLGNWLESQAKLVTSGTLKAGTYHACLRSIILATPYATEFAERERTEDPTTLFRDIYPFYGELALETSGPLLDTLVVDEAQDLLSRPVLDVFNRWLSGGLAGGHWAVFGDFTRQALYNCQATGPYLLDEYCNHYTKARLTLNCRNTRRIGEETVLLSGFESPPYRNGQVDGLPVEYHYWQSTEEQGRLCVRIIERLLGDGIQPSDIVLLSPKSWDMSVASRLGAVRNISIVNVPAASQLPPRAIHWSTIHAFKGMESPVVMIVDLDLADQVARQSLLYVAMSRARSHLVLLANESLRKAIADGVMRRLMAGQGR